ncbi:YjdF family protein [Clostridium sp. C2-6-12]|uniref:YjdF family protein n=1 Tax=Clostridium sp. C2-6-12 TaxID=2698832 RepID=UPI001369DEEF|nr:YjdF family protein [Clostridium sp. C2-6-12]
MISQINLTVLFSEPFWIGVFELTEDEEYKVCKVTFGSEPREDETLDFVLKRFYSLNFSSPISTDKNVLVEKKLNPKRIQRKIQKETSTNGIGTKAQIALKLQHEQCKVERKKKSKAQKELEEQRKFELKQKKRLEKRKGH